VLPALLVSAVASLRWIIIGVNRSRSSRSHECDENHTQNVWNSKPLTAWGESFWSRLCKRQGSGKSKPFSIRKCWSASAFF